MVRRLWYQCDNGPSDSRRRTERAISNSYTKKDHQQPRKGPGLFSDKVARAVRPRIQAGEGGWVEKGKTKGYGAAEQSQRGKGNRFFYGRTPN